MLCWDIREDVGSNNILDLCKETRLSDMLETLNIPSLFELTREKRNIFQKGHFLFKIF